VPAPEGFVKMIIPPDNPLTYEGVALGRALFFDPILSQDSSISCASCHQPALAFTDGGAVSRGIAGRMGQRSAPSLLNIGFHYKGVFWDGRSPTLEEQALHPLGDSLEMGNQWSTIEERLRQHPAYRIRFQEAFPNAPIGQETTAKALAQFQRTLVSANSKFDQVMRGEAQFTPEEKRGWTIFFDAGFPETPMAECSHCHTDPLFTNLNFSNNGLDESSSLNEFPDRGLGQISGNKYDNGKFRVPTLRNILITAPYMHDGRFRTIEEVIQHYNNGGKYAENVDPNVRPLHLSDKDQQDLITFLQTLTDSAALTNQSYYSAKN
jgi:cytochrome c peroxidase